MSSRPSHECEDIAPYDPEFVTLAERAGVPMPPAIVRSILQLLEVGISPQAVVCALREILLKPKADKPKHPHGHMTYDTFSSTQQSIQQQRLEEFVTAIEQSGEEDRKRAD